MTNQGTKSLIIDLLQKRILLINAEYSKLVEEERGIELSLKNLEMEKVKLELQLLDIEAKLEQLEAKVLADIITR